MTDDVAMCRPTIGKKEILIQTIKAAIKSVEEEIEIEEGETAAIARARSASPGKKTREGSRSPEKAVKPRVTIIEDKERQQSYRDVIKAGPCRLRDCAP